MSGSPAKLKGYLRFFSDGTHVYAFIKDDPKDTGFADLPSDKALGLEAPDPTEAGEEGGEEAADEEPEPEPEPEAEPAAEEAAPAEGAEGAPPAAEEEKPPEVVRDPDRVFKLDPLTGVWESGLLAESPVPEPDFEKLREHRMAALAKMGVPDKMVSTCCGTSPLLSSPLLSHLTSISPLI